MNRTNKSLHAKVHNWINSVGFRLNASQTNTENNEVTNHYFFETFNFIERLKGPGRSKFLCFDMYGEKMNVKSLLDLQAAFFENISQLK